MKRKIVLISTALIFLMQPCIFAQKSQEKDDLSLFEIDRLIRRTEYDEALRQLNIYIEKNPEKFDNAQTRIKRIMNARNQYSILAEKLINLIQTDPGNNKEIYEITAQLEKFEKHPSDQNLQFIADLKKSAEFNYFRSVFMEIQTETAERSGRGEYVASVEKAKEGFWLYRDNFYDQHEEQPEIIQNVDSILADLDTRLAAFEEKNYLTRLNSTVDAFIKAVNADQYEQALSRFSEVEASFENYNKLRLAIINDSLALQTQFAQIQEIDADTTDASFLPFMFRFISGIESVPGSGILGAVDAWWNDSAGKMNEAVYAMLLKKYELYSNALNQPFVDGVQKYALLDNRVLDLYKISESTEAEPLNNPYADYYTYTNYASSLSDEAFRISGVYENVRSAQASQQQIIARLKNGNLTDAEQGEAVKNLFDSNENLQKLIGIKENQLLEGFSWAIEYEAASETAERRDFEGLSLLYSQTLDKVFEESSQILFTSWTQIADYYSGSSEAIYQNTLAYSKSADIYREGFFTKIPDQTLRLLNSDISKSIEYQDSFSSERELDFGIYYSYPDLSLKIANYTQECVAEGTREIERYQTVLKENYELHPQWKDNEEITLLLEETDAALENQKRKLSEINITAANQIAAARSQMNASQLARNEADIRFTEAQAALRREDFETARKKLQDALTKYDEALNAQNDEMLRAETDEKLQSLGQSIAKAENEFVVREVRELKTLAKDAYFNGRFEDAEKYLNQAKIRWAVTNVSEDEEITNLLNFVNTAVSMKTGREILPSAPQYPEMSQLLNMAYQYFDEGSRKIGDGDRAGGVADLTLALDSIQKLQYVYPLNQEASILTLRINRLMDPQKFTEEFSQKIEMAKLMCQSVNTRQEGYANLLDYYELEPTYKGLKDLIYQVEIDIGIRQKPVTSSGTSRAMKLIADAKSIYNSAGNDTKKLENALAKVDEALALVSDNKEAMDLKDKITTKIGGNTATVLSTEDERLYQLAIQRLQNNNVVGANAIVEQLLKKPQNVNSQKIKDLKNKIEARS